MTLLNVVEIPRLETPGGTKCVALITCASVTCGPGSQCVEFATNAACVPQSGGDRPDVDDPGDDAENVSSLTCASVRCGSPTPMCVEKSAEEARCSTNVVRLVRKLAKFWAS